MTDKDLRKLSRMELLEMLLEKSREVDRLQKENENLKIYMKQRLEDRRIMLQNAGSIAEASLRLNNVFKAAQMAADQYVENVRLLCEEQQKKLAGSGNNAEKTKGAAAGDTANGTDRS